MPAASFHGDLLDTGGPIVVGTDVPGTGEGLVYAFDRETGSLRWKAALGDVGSDLVAFGERVLGTTMEGGAFALDRADGRLVWRFDTVSKGGVLNADPLLEGGRFSFRDTSTVYALDPETGKLLWQRAPGGRLNTSLAGHGGAIATANLAGTVYLLDAATGEIRAERHLGDMVYGNLTAAGECLLALSVSGKEHHLSCLVGDTLEPRWHRTSPVEWSAFQPWFGGGVTIAGNAQGEVLVLRLNDGQVVLSTQVAGVVRGLGRAGGRIYVGTWKGTVLALEAGEFEVGE